MLRSFELENLLSFSYLAQKERQREIYLRRRNNINHLVLLNCLGDQRVNQSIVAHNIFVVDENVIRNDSIVGRGRVPNLQIVFIAIRLAFALVLAFANVENFSEEIKIKILGRNVLLQNR